LDFNVEGMPRYEGGDHQVPNTNRIHAVSKRGLFEIETQSGSAASGFENARLA
jgi:hypothetical protein